MTSNDTDDGEERGALEKLQSTDALDVPLWLTIAMIPIVVLLAPLTFHAVSDRSGHINWTHLGFVITGFLVWIFILTQVVNYV